MAAIVVVIVYLVMAMIMGVGQISQGKVLARTTIGTLPVGDMTYEAAQQAFDARVKEILDEGVQATFRGEQFAIEMILSDPGNPEIAYPLVSYDTQSTMASLKEREANYNPLERLIAYVFIQDVEPVATVDTERLQEVIQKELAQYETPAQDARLLVSGDTITVEPEKEGLAFAHREIVASISEQLQALSIPSITLELEKDIPEIALSEAQAKVPDAQKILAGAPYLVVYDDKKWALDKDLVSGMLAVFRQTSEPLQTADARVRGTSDQVMVGLAPGTLAEYLETTMVKGINVEAQRGKFEMKNGRVVEFQPSRTGLTLDVDKSVDEVNNALQAAITGSTIEPVTLVVTESEPDVTVGDVNTFGIKELVGRGSTNFKGSPKNRRFNINLAAEKLNGILIAPGETFSLVKALSPIDTSNGYLPELVIKGNRTIPEVGGGLCQIGTTFFRLVLDAGLPIVERKNHSYRVSYYEPPVGMDATIYDPKPDFRFTNDYSSYLLLQTYVKGDDITFEFYGTKDGRKASTTTPRVYNVVKPGPTKIIETTDLKPGERKCIEKPHNGSDAEFTYTVTYADGRVATEKFTSHYRPWQEVCLVGVAEKSPDTEETQLENAPEANAVQ